MKNYSASYQVIPTPLHVLGRISPILSPFFPFFARFHRLAETVPTSPKPEPRAKKQPAGQLGGLSWRFGVDGQNVDNVHSMSREAMPANARSDPEDPKQTVVRATNVRLPLLPPFNTCSKILLITAACAPSRGCTRGSRGRRRLRTAYGRGSSTAPVWTLKARGASRLRRPLAARHPHRRRKVPNTLPGVLDGASLGSGIAVPLAAGEQYTDWGTTVPGSDLRLGPVGAAVLLKSSTQ